MYFTAKSNDGRGSKEYLKKIFSTYSKMEETILNGYGHCPISCKYSLCMDFQPVYSKKLRAYHDNELVKYNEKIAHP